MKLLEIDAKRMFKRHGLAIPSGVLLDAGDDLPSGWSGRTAVKAQVLFGGRGKQGLVQLVPSKVLMDTVTAMRRALARRNLPELVMLEEQLEVAAEYYLSIRINDISQCPEIVFCITGGVEVEGNSSLLRIFAIDPLSELHAHKLVVFLREAGVPGKLIGPVARFAASAFRMFMLEDADLIEINPLAITADGRVIALDGKASVDDSAAFRHPEWSAWQSGRMRMAGLTELERQAQHEGLTFIEMDGNVAVLSGGAGLGMLVLDAIVDTGNRPANFVDAIGGASPEVFKRQVEIIFDSARRPQVEAIITFFTVTATPLASIVGALLEVIASNPPPKPLIVGLLAGGAAEATMSLADAKRQLGLKGIECVAELSDLMAALSRMLPADKFTETVN